MVDKSKDRPARSDARWWVVQQHQKVEVVESAERPPSEVAKGERIKRVSGPYPSRDAARKVRDGRHERTLKARAGRGE